MQILEFLSCCGLEKEFQSLSIADCICRPYVEGEWIGKIVQRFYEFIVLICPHFFIFPKLIGGRSFIRKQWNCGLLANTMRCNREGLIFKILPQAKKKFIIMPKGPVG
jgi:hypothetical protein